MAVEELQSIIKRCQILGPGVRPALPEVEKEEEGKRQARGSAVHYSIKIRKIIRNGCGGTSEHNKKMSNPRRA